MGRSKKLFVSFFAVLLIAFAATFVSFAEDGDFPHEHDWEFVSHTDYTCTEDGYDLYVCSTCGEEERRVTDEASHRNELVSEREADCETEGEMVYVCSVCGEKTVITTPALGHSWVDEGTERRPTLFTAGAEKFVCKRDSSHVMYEEIPSELSSSPTSALSLILIASAIALAFLVTAVKLLVDKLRSKRKGNKEE